jgi:hypothetical protein
LRIASGPHQVAQTSSSSNDDIREGVIETAMTRSL